MGGLALLYFGAEWLVRGASALGVKAGLSALVIGLTVVAFGTSAPELMVSVESALMGKGDIAVGNVVGSNIANIALILGIAAMIRPLQVNTQVVRREVPLVIAASVLLCALLWDGTLGRIDGAIMFVLLVAYTGLSLYDARRETNPAIEQEYADVARGGTRPAWQYAGLAAIGLAVLLVGADLLVGGAIRVAAVFGVPEVIVGLTIVAIGTSLPELATSAIASYRREGDIAVGNVLGSNLFNILGILGIAAMVMPLTAGGITLVDLGMMVAITVVIIPLVMTRLVISRLEGGLLVLGYVAYLTWLVAGV